MRSVLSTMQKFDSFLLFLAPLAFTLQENKNEEINQKKFFVFRYNFCF